ncbi:MAG: hypothetical protein QOJ42_7735 [Acidobacteriaceae bacterium]|nr:hypothetical protein [Acidobacteriaceae bacterium]
MGRDLLSSGDLARAFGYRNAGAIHARLVVRTSHCLNPREDIGALLGQQPSAFLLIEKQNRTWGEAFLFCSGDSGCGVGSAKGCCIFAFEFFVQASVVQDHEAETVGLEQGALTQPAIAVRARRIVQPITGVGKAAVKSGEQVIAGIVVLVETQVVTLP